MKIKEITSMGIVFDNGCKITTYHESDCREAVYADFEQIDSIAYTMEFDEDLKFEKIENYGFRFGNNEFNMVAVPCYDVQNGYYNSDLDILYYHSHWSNEKVLDSDTRHIYDGNLETAIREGYIDENISFDDQVRYYVANEDKIWKERDEKFEAEKEEREDYAERAFKELEESLKDPKTQKYMNMFHCVSLTEVPYLGDDDDEDQKDR